MQLDLRTFIFQDKFCERSKKTFCFNNLKSRISQLSYALSSVKKYLKLAFLSYIKLAISLVKYMPQVTAISTLKKFFLFENLQL